MDAIQWRMYNDCPGDSKHCGTLYYNTDYQAEVFSLTNFNSQRSIGWAHHATAYWGNTSVRDATDRHGLKMPLPCDDDQPYFNPILFHDKVHINGMAIGKKLKRYKYNVYWYDTRGNGAFIEGPQIKVGLTGTLQSYIPNWGGYDYAFKVFPSTETYPFKTTLAEDELADIDTLKCPIDTLRFDGVYGDDINGAFSYKWNFGNGQTSTQVHPRYYYSVPGLYTVTLIVTDTQGVKDTLMQRFFVSNCAAAKTTGENDEEKIKEDNGFNIHPNPGSGLFNLAFSEEDVKNVYVYDVMGKVIFKQENIHEHTLQVDLTDHLPGIYFVKVMSGNKITSKKIIKQ